MNKNLNVQVSLRQVKNTILKDGKTMIKPGKVMTKKLKKQKCMNGEMTGGKRS